MLFNTLGPTILLLLRLLLLLYYYYYYYFHSDIFHVYWLLESTYMAAEYSDIAAN